MRQIQSDAEGDAGVEDASQDGQETTAGESYLNSAANLSFSVAVLCNVFFLHIINCPVFPSVL